VSEGSPLNLSNCNESGRITLGSANSTSFYVKMAAFSELNCAKPVYINPGLPHANGMGCWEVFYYTSSRRYKDNIEPFLSGIEEILKLNPVTWTGKPANKNRENELESRRDIGFIAEEVYDSELNYFVAFDSDGNPDFVYYDKISVLAVNAIKELHEEQKLLKARIVELENLVNNN